MIGGFFMHAKQAQGRAALAGGGRKADYHRIGDACSAAVDRPTSRDAARLGNQRNDRAVLRGGAALDDLGDLG